MGTIALDVSVVICAYTAERWEHLVAAVASARCQTAAPLEVVVVIDHNPQLFERAHTAFDDVIVIENTAASGLSGARNSGINAASGDVIAFLDDDALAMPEWIADLQRAYDEPQIVGVGGTVTPNWESGRPRWFPAEFDWVVGCTYCGMPTTAAPVRNLIGANMSFRRSLFTTIGGFRSGVGQVGESMLRCDDTEFGIRIRQQLPTAVVRYDPSVRVMHTVPAARARWAYFRTRCYTEGIAKAQITQLAGAADGLSSERLYTLQTLPRAVRRNVAATLTQRDAAGVLRAGAIVIGLATTMAGYAVGLLVQLFTAHAKRIPAATVVAER